MSDKLPPLDDLTISDRHFYWHFEILPTSQINFVVELQEGALSEIILNLAYIPVVATFDLEYWKAMQILKKIDNTEYVNTKRKMMAKYMQNMRCAITQAILIADPSQLKDGSWKLPVGQEWWIRTVNHYNHSYFGREQYKQYCLQKNQQIYVEDPKPTSEFVI